MLVERLLEGMSIDGTPFLEAGSQHNAPMIELLERLFEGMSVNGTPCFQANSHGLESKEPGVAGAQPRPHSQTECLKESPLLAPHSLKQIRIAQNLTCAGGFT